MNVVRYMGRQYRIEGGAIVAEPSYMVEAPDGTRRILRLSQLLAHV